MATKTKAKGSGRVGARGTAAGMRAGAKTRTEARQLTSDTGKQTKKELTKRGGPGRAGTADKRAAKPSTAKATKRSATRGRGDKASAGA